VYRRILVAVDGSRPSALALDEAIRLAREQPESMLRVLHVVNEGLTLPPGVLSPNLAETDEQAYTQGRAVLDAAESQARGAGVRVEGILAGAVAQRAGARIVDEASEWSADLIVCGTHGRGGIVRLVLGSDAEYVVRHARVPVLLLRSPD
jgi:nucleotide-binding universal stress UspA family protein